MTKPTKTPVALDAFYDADHSLVRQGSTYWGRPDRPVHIFTEASDGRRVPTLCGLRIDGGHGLLFDHVEKITCKRCAARLTELLLATIETSKENIVPEIAPESDHTGDPLQRCMHCKYCGHGLHRWRLEEAWIGVFGNVQCEQAPRTSDDLFGAHEPGSPVATRPEPEPVADMVPDLSALPVPIIPKILI